MLPSPERSTWLSREILPHEQALRAWLKSRRVAGLEAEDILQETYAVLAGLPAVAHIKSPRAYAFQTAKSIIARHLYRARIVRIDSVGDTAQLDSPMEDPSPERQASSRQDLRVVLEVIAQLPPKRREAFTLRRIDGLSQREIARRMGISESTVEKHIAHALARLLDAMGGASREPAQPSPRGRRQEAYRGRELQRAT